jgi:hypothetical protein
LIELDFITVKSGAFVVNNYVPSGTDGIPVYLILHLITVEFYVCFLGLRTGLNCKNYL